MLIINVLYTSLTGMGKEEMGFSENFCQNSTIFGVHLHPYRLLLTSKNFLAESFIYEPRPANTNETKLSNCRHRRHGGVFQLARFR